MNNFISFLREIAPYVVVVGSFARENEHDESDIDCFLRSRPRHEVDLENPKTETYMHEILEIIKRYGFITDSVIVGHVNIEQQQGVPRMVEIASYYRIPHNERLTVREIYGVPFLCAADNKESRYEDCYDCTEWSNDDSDMIIPYPLPKYDDIVPK